MLRIVTASAAAMTLSQAAAQPCALELQPFTDGLADFPIFNGAVFDAAVFNDGTGPALYIAGGFTAPGMPSSRLVRWRPGEGFTAVNTGLNFTAYALAVHDDGSGPSLFVGGNFSQADGVAASAIARYDGTDFFPVGSGLNGAVTALAVYEGQLYAGGEFTSAGGVPASHIARWDGANWSAVGAGLSRTGILDVFTVRDLHVHNDGSGNALYVAGGFTGAGGIATNGLARWTNAGGWESIGSVNGLSRTIWSLETFNAGSGPRLFAAGRFNAMGATPISGGLAQWDGTTWSSPATFAGSMDQVASVTLGGVPNLFIAGSYTSVNANSSLHHLTRWNGSTFFPEDLGSITSAQTITPFPVGNQAVLIGGTFPPYAQFRHNGDWSAPDGLMGGSKGDILFVNEPHLGGPALYLSGSSIKTRDGLDHGLVRLQGDTWVPVGAPSDSIEVIAVDRTVNPARLLAVTLNRVFAFNGTTWSPLGSPFTDAFLDEIVVIENGNARGVYVAGSGGIWKLNASNDWTPISPGFFHVFDMVAATIPGFGTQLYVGGGTGAFGENIARYDGNNWRRVGEGLNSTVLDLAAADLGNGMRLYAAGLFSSSNGTPINGFAQWDGSGWSPVGSGPAQTTTSLTIFDDGSGPRLYAVRGNQLVAWDGQSFDTIMTLPGSATMDEDVVDDGTSRRLFFHVVLSSNYPEGLAYIEACDDAPTCQPDLTGSSDPNSPDYGEPNGALDADDFFFYLDQFVAGNLGLADLTGSSDPNDPTYGDPDGVLDGSDFFYYLDLFVAGCP